MDRRRIAVLSLAAFVFGCSSGSGGGDGDSGANDAGAEAPTPETGDDSICLPAYPTAGCTGSAHLCSETCDAPVDRFACGCDGKIHEYACSPPVPWSYETSGSPGDEGKPCDPTDAAADVSGSDGD